MKNDDFEKKHKRDPKGRFATKPNTAMPVAAPVHKVNLEMSTLDPLSQINSLIEDRPVWRSLVEASGLRSGTKPAAFYTIEKDLYVTEALRQAVQPSQRYPEAQVVFKGGTSLAKAYPILHRVSEDIDINVVPPVDSDFGANRRKNALKEIRDRLAEVWSPSELESNIRSNFGRINARYLSKVAGDSRDLDMQIGTVIVEIMVREQSHKLSSERTVTSLAGEAASQIDPALQDRYPCLAPFKVLTADPIIALSDKLDALNKRSESDNPSDAGKRARDIYDLACLLSDEDISSRVNSDLISELHEAQMNPASENLKPRNAMPRPADGFASSKAFQEGSEAYESLKQAYPRLKSVMYTEDDWIEFEDAVQIIRNNAEKL